MSAATAVTMRGCAHPSLRVIRRAVRGPGHMHLVAPRHFRVCAKVPQEGPVRGEEQLPPLQSQQQQSQQQHHDGHKRGLSRRWGRGGPLGRPFDALMREFDDIFNHPLMPVPRPFGSPFVLAEKLFDTPMLSNLQSLMGLEVTEDEDKYSIKADVPGFSRENIRITLSDDGVLSIEGHERQETREPAAAAAAAAATGGEGDTAEASPAQAEATPTPAATTRTERSFVRRLQVPDGVRFDGIEAKVEHGQLFITLPKMEQPKAEATKEIPIN